MNVTRLAMLSALVGALLALSSCSFFDTQGAETGISRGAKAFDPYAGPASGAIRLGLQQFNGCAILATGERLAKGSANIPYPDSCATAPPFPGQPAPTPGGATLTLVSGTTYFLGQFAVTNMVLDAHKDPADSAAPVRWMRAAPDFAMLDWTGFGLVNDDIMASGASQAPWAFDRQVMFGGAAWQRETDDTFLLEVLDAEANVRQQISYTRRDFFVQNPIGGHTQTIWRYGPFGPPRFPGDLVPQPIPPPPPAFPPPGPLSSSTSVRFEMHGTTHPEKTFKLSSELAGAGALRVTWSLRPSQPFYFPVSFVQADTLAETCFAGDDDSRKVPCDFGLAPEVRFTPPADGEAYAPGERFEVTLAVRDGSGNRLHPRDRFFTYNEQQRGDSNGLLYFSPFALTTGERDTIMGMVLAGPLQQMRPFYELKKDTFLMLQDFVEGSTTDTVGTGFDIIPNVLSVVGVVPGGADLAPPTTRRFRVPENAPPGTYVVALKTHRQFHGERFTKAVPFYFQVGQAKRTSFPGRIGNCQLCHRGVLSLDNVRHGFPVEFVEGCKACHNRQDFATGPDGQIFSLVHRLHMLSPKYPRPKNDCATCHLTRESTLAPSYAVCSSCHLQLHGNEFARLQFTTDRDDTVEPTPFSSCASGCHVLTPPATHILPER